MSNLFKKIIKILLGILPKDLLRYIRRIYFYFFFRSNLSSIGFKDYLKAYLTLEAFPKLLYNTLMELPPYLKSKYVYFLRIILYLVGGSLCPIIIFDYSIMFSSYLNIIYFLYFITGLEMFIILLIKIHFQYKKLKADFLSKKKK
jgi:hypothetical protein